MTRYSDQVRDEFGRPVPGVQVYVYNAVGTLDALTDDAALPLVNPVVSDEFGGFYFNAADGQKLLEFHYGGELRYRDQILVGPLPVGPTGPAGDVARAADRAALAAIAGMAAGATRYVTESGRAGLFVWEAPTTATGSIAGTTLTLTAGGPFLVGRAITGTGVTAGTTITAAASPTSYTVSASQTVASTQITANLSAQVTADPNQGVYVAPASDPTGASGAWAREYGNRIKARWFGLALNGSNDGPKVLSAYTLAFALAGTNFVGLGPAAPSIELPFTPSGINMGSTTIPLTKAIATYGETGGTVGGAATELHWTGDCNGFEVRAANCYFDGLALGGSWTAGSPAEGEYHAIKGYQKFGYGKLLVYNWRGDGIHINVTAGSGGDTEGNCNGTYGGVLAVLACRRGISLEGADANACSFGFIDANYCRQGGVYEFSFLGNAYDVIQTSGNGVSGYGTPSAVFNNGHIFVPQNGQIIGAATNSPPATATSNTWWLYWKDAGAATAYAPQWVNGMSLRYGGAFVSPAEALNNVSSVDYMYVESDQPPIQAAQKVLFKGGLNAAGWGPATRFITAENAGVRIGPGLVVAGIISADYVSATLDGSIFGSTTADSLAKVMVKGTAQALRFGTGSGFAQIQAVNPAGSAYQPMALDGTGVYLLFEGAVKGATTATGLAVTGDTTTSGVFKVGSSQVVGAQGAAVPDAAALTSANASVAVAAPTKAEFDALVAEFNKLRTDVAAVRTTGNTHLARDRAHGLIAT
jgi:hypothetical protein